jgi:uncharacterized protein (DUF58 family)
MCRRLIALVALLVLAGCTLTAAEPAPPPPANRIEFVVPANNVRIPEGTELIIQLVAQDPKGVARVQLVVDESPHLEAKPVDQLTVPVFVVDMNWLAEGAGRHSMTAISYLADGSISAAEIISIEVEGAEATEEAS